MAKKLEYNTDYLFNYDVKESVNSIIDEVDGLKSDVNGLIDGVPSLSVVSLSPAVAPTVTMGLSVKTLPKTHDKLTSRMLNLGGVFSQAGSVHPDNQYITNNGTVSYGTGTVSSPRVVKHFVFNGLKFEFKYKEVLGSYEIIVDGVSSGVQSLNTTTGSTKYASVEFTTVATRLITVIGHNTFLGDFYTGNSDTVMTPAVGKKVIFAGDSYTEGTGADIGKGFVNVLMSKYGLSNVVNSGLGGTGYLMPSGGRPALIDRYQSDIINQSPDVVVLAMGTNDQSLDLDLVDAAASEVITQIRSQRPNCQIIMTGAFSPRTPVQMVIDINSRLGEIAIRFGIPYINTAKNATETWFYGTGKLSAPQGDGNCDVLISGDGSHPTNAGHEYIASMLHMHIGRTGVSIR